MMSRLLCTDVLAIRSIGNYVFVGIGCFLHVFKKSVNYELVYKLKFYNNVHGIFKTSNDCIIIFGAKCLCIYQINETDGTIKLEKCFDPIWFKDWIIASKLLTTDRQTLLIVLFAHNNVCLYDISSKKQQYISCEEKCILYGGSISGQTIKDLIIFSGTVFQEILIWKPSYDAIHNKNAKILHRLSGHNGVIFSVIYDPNTHFICSTSDDRTVRLWKVEETVQCSLSCKNTVNWEKVKIVLAMTMFGHAARVWRAMIRDGVLVTIGEDSSVCIWSLNGTLLNKLLAHRGAAIWSIDISEDNKTIFTGGADGAIHTWPFICTPSTYLQIMPSPKTYNVPKYVSYLNNETLLIFHEGGTLACYNDALCLRECRYLEKYNSYCIMQISPCRRYISFASRDGYITIYTENENEQHLQEVLSDKVMGSKIFSLQWLRNDTVIVCGENGCLRVLVIASDNKIHSHSEYLLPPSQERWVTAAIIYEKLLICGDRAGSLHVFELHDNSVDDKINLDKNIYKPIQTIRKAHGNIGIQVCSILEKKLLTGGRNGTIRFYDTCIIEGRKFLRPLYCVKMPMDWISNILNINNDILIAGFKEVEFRIYDLHNQRIVLKSPCGGGHRSWDCMVSCEKIKFAYIRNKQIYLSSHQLHSLSLSMPAILSGSHVKEIYNIQPIISPIDKKLYISGGKDCKLHLTYIDNPDLEKTNYTFRTLGIFDGHISSIKSIAIVNLENVESKSIYLIFSCGGRAQIKCWQMDIRWDKDVLTNESVSCIDLNNHMLFGKDQSRRRHWQKMKQSYVIEPETRYMDIKIYYPSFKSPCVLVLVACADGYLRMFIYNIATNDIHPVLYTKCAAHCILKIHVMEFKGQLIVLTMSTDGIVRYFTFTNMISEVFKNTNSNSYNLQIIDIIPFATIKLHQSGINSYDLRNINDDHYLLVTGGDDNLLSLLLFQIFISEETNNLSVQIVSKYEASSVHCAQITGIKLTDNKIFSVGIDQQVVTHIYSCTNNKISAQILSTELTFVSDIQGMVLSNDALLCVYGNGFELLSV